MNWCFSASPHDIPALADARHTYIINGNWVIDWPGRYDVAGTTIYYGRSGADNETITAEGPIKEELFLMLIFREENKGVRFQFWIPTDKLSQIKLDFTPVSVTGTGRGHKNSATSRGNINKEYNHLKTTQRTFLEKSYNRLNAEQKSRLNQQRRVDGQRQNVPRYSSTGQRQNVPRYSSTGLSNDNIKVPSQTGGIGQTYNTRRRSGYHHPPVSPIYADNTRKSGDDIEHISKTQAWWEALKRRRAAAQDVIPPAARLGDDSQQVKTWHHRDERRISHRGALPNHVVPTSTTAPTTEEPRTKKKTVKEPRAKRPKKTNILDTEKGSCGPCSKSKNRARHFCTSQFVVRMVVLNAEHIGSKNDTRYDVEIVEKYKDTISLLSREYIWVPNRCNCPRIQKNKEYIAMGSLVTDSQTREGRLQLSRKSFVRSYNQANNNRLRSLMKRINCDKYG